MDNLHICLVDNSDCGSIEGVHKKLRAFRIKQEEYYTKYYPRADLMTKEPIEFKSIDQYFAAYFKSKVNMKKWYLSFPKEAKELSIKILRERIARKNLTRLPGEIELISANFPSAQYYYTFIGDAFLPFGSGGFCKPFDYDIKKFEFNTPSGKVVIDTREQQPLNLLKTEIISRKLDFGDYAIEGNENKIVVERKNLADLIASCVTQYDRFRREFERAKAAGAYMVVVCEENFPTAMSFNYIPYFQRYTKMRPEAVFHNIRELMKDFDCQFVFCNGRVHAAETILKILFSKHVVKSIDLQWCIDRAKIL